MRRLVCEYYDGFSFGNFMRKHPEMRGTVTDLLIGDLFTDKVDKVWEPMQEMYEEQKEGFAQWSDCLDDDKAHHRRNELVLPVGPRPSFR